MRSSRGTGRFTVRSSTCRERWFAELPSISRTRAVRSGRRNRTRTASSRLIILPPKYSLAVTARGFAQYENAAIDIAAGKSLSVDVTLSITVNEKVTVGGEAPINTSPDANAGAIVLKGEDQITRLVARAVTRTVRVRSRQTSLT